MKSLHQRQTILTHAAAGATGSAAIQFARYLGAEIFTTVSTNEMKQWLTENSFFIAAIKILQVPFDQFALVPV
ncbi:polyketide synthase [Penicillium cinerascens]|uniref:Polyketide synthase n=1 Tax=Penicillium cinerascens TaxID=70096 RepID=A0A9W9M5A9_9EURO|nr:polyketide synthase [Penicillium cinerascens]KAJ5190256.1 polyketide synthase [Penicillium cinerascens]